LTIEVHTHDARCFHNATPYGQTDVASATRGNEQNHCRW
jgi:hypothetical protein